MNVEYGTKEIKQIIIKNISLMLERRKLITNSDKTYDEIDFSNNNQDTFKIKLNNNEIWEIHFVNAKILSISQGTPLDDYLSNNIDIHKIIVIKQIAKKTAKQLMYDYVNVEFFIEHELMEDIPSKIFIPEHQVLTKDQKEELLSKFPESNLSKILITDIMSRYYGTKVGDIFRIVRSSMVAGKNIYYRRVVVTPNALDILFSS